MAEATPEDWPDAQRRFHLAYLEDPATFPRHEVELVSITRPDTAWNLDVVTGRHDGVEATVTELGGERRSLRFAVAPDQVPPRMGGLVPGVLVGDWGPNAALCVEVDGGVVWPAYNPVAVDARAAESTRSEARGQRLFRSPSPPEWWLEASKGTRAVVTVIAVVAAVAVRLGTRWAFSDGSPDWLQPLRVASAVAVLAGAWYWLLKKDEEPPSGS